MNNNSKIPRRKFLKSIAGLLVIPSIAVWIESIKTRLKINLKSKKIVLPPDLNEGIVFYDGLIVKKNGENIKIFSSTCTHLGCKINQEKNNRFVCPCHGSQFTLSGEVVKGPATKNLMQLNFTKDKKTGKIIVYAG